MQLYLAARILAVVSVASATALLHPRAFLFLTIAAAFSHYLGALLFSGERMRWFARSSTGLLCGGTVLAAGTLITWTNTPHWAVYGILHYLKGDVAAARVQAKPEDFWMGYGGRLLVNLCGAAFVFRHELGVPGVVPALLWAGTWLCFGPALWRHRKNASRADWANLVAFELIIVGIAVLSLFHTVTFPQASLAHFLFWAVLPAGRLGARGLAPAALFLATLLGLGAVVYLVSPEGLLNLGWSTNEWTRAWSYGSNLHITASLVMTAAMQSRLSASRQEAFVSS